MTSSELYQKALRLAPWLAAIVVILGTAGVYAGRASLESDLPSIESLRELQLSVPLRIYTEDNKLIGEFGAERRALLKYKALPPKVVQAFLAAEDANFFQHSGVDYMGLLRAGVKLATTGDKAQGGSTITMQLARNVFLSSEKTFTRKFREILLAQKIERELTKEEILELYLNKIYLGERAYGVGAAAKVYFDKDVKDLTLSEIAVIASLPKAPSTNNPVKNPARAAERRNYVLRRMLELNYITKQEYTAAVASPVVVRPAHMAVDVDAHYVAEMVRVEMFTKYGEDAYNRGFTVITTINANRQIAANAALRRSLLDYDERHGYRGAEAKLTPDLIPLLTAGSPKIDLALDERPLLSGLVPAVVTAFTADTLQLLTRTGRVSVAQNDFKWANFSAKKTLLPGDIVRIKRVGERWRLAQVPQVQGAFVALDPKDGAIEALIGGYDFFQGKFNRATQARRQVGSGFKPFLYATALANGYTPASVFLDAPVVFDDPNLESAWRPENYGGSFNGPMRMREALVQSRNLVSIRILMALGINTAREFIPRFGLPADRMPRDLTLALGTAVYTPLELARGYATIANGGFLVSPYFIREIRDAKGAVLLKAAPKVACSSCGLPPPAEPAPDGTAPANPTATAPPAAAPLSTAGSAPRVVDPQVIWLISDMLHDVTVRGTAAAVNSLGRSDLAGKTGTSNDETDAWFNGFQKDLVAVSWVGFDQPTPMGRGEVGGRAALPIWMDFMRVALKGVPQERLPRPSGLANVRIDPLTGKLADADDANAIFETVQADRIPAADSGTEAPKEKSAAEDLF
ncbi:penicillin-binding protein 1A [Stenotrophobium rhamnosiphilum]|uniref:Penicillin-binding protein 1A n=1 Tax=Stenotrophobium rhamnosiphilum TaxID=2029166 RepID=A0A2T5MFC4_9GAMM|nr:penicillin-binding protein 1A [Stenotrophobium rhamnosiphilum]PTU31278.1 peptidase [Stenotrophobium rhamnosiphilum]